MKSCHYGSSCGHKQGKSVLSYPPGKHANLKTDFTAQLCGKTRLDATHFVQPPSCPKPTSTPTFPHHNNEKSKKMPHFLSFNPNRGRSADTNSRTSSSTTRTVDAHRTGKPSIQRQSPHNGADHRGRYAPLYRLAGHQTTACPSSLLDFCTVPRTLTLVQP